MDTTPDLNATTNIDAYCEFKKDTADNWQVMDITGGLYHGHTLSTLSYGDHVYYVNCNNTESNFANDSIAS